MTAPVQIGNYILTMLLDAGSEINLMPHSTYEDLGLMMEEDVRWCMCNANSKMTNLLGVCKDVLIGISGITEKFHVFVGKSCEYDIILGRQWEAAMCTAYRNLNDGSCWIKMYLHDSLKAIQLMVASPQHPRNWETIRRADF